VTAISDSGCELRVQPAGGQNFPGEAYERDLKPAAILGSGETTRNPFGSSCREKVAIQGQKIKSFSGKMKLVAKRRQNYPRPFCPHSRAVPGITREIAHHP